MSALLFAELLGNRNIGSNFGSCDQCKNFLGILVLFRSCIGRRILHQESQQQCPNIPGRVCLCWSEGNHSSLHQHSSRGSVHQEPFLLSVLMYLQFCVSTSKYGLICIQLGSLRFAHLFFVNYSA